MVWQSLLLVVALFAAEPPLGHVISVGENVVTIDRGREHGIQPGAVIDVYQMEQVQNADTSETYEREVRAGGLLVEEVEDRFSTCRIISSQRPIAVGDTLRNRVHSIVRNVSSTQNFFYADLTSSAVKWMKPGARVMVYRRMEIIHPVSNRRISWMEKIGEATVLNVTIRTFSARCNVQSYVKPILENDLLMPLENSKKELSEIHLLNIYGDKVLINKTDDMLPNAEFVMIKEMPNNPDEKFLISKIKIVQPYKLTAEAQLLTPEHKDKLRIGDKVKMYAY